MLEVHLLDEIGFVLHLPLHLAAMVPVARESGVHVGHRELWESRDDLVGRQPLQFVPDINILDADARAADLRAYFAWRSHSSITQPTFASASGEQWAGVSCCVRQ